ncbi:UNVERIFIED_CONTAM: hypothetical protein GTU68_029506 [Idotea baltica]|nr:hypothetical protein [Idotea baltica]
MSESLDTLRSGGKPALARMLARLESHAHEAETIALLDAAFAAPKGRSLGLTGPPGVGKSSLTNVLLREARARGLTVGAIAVDPSSSRTGGALLGDRARLSSLDPSDDGVFVRSMAARGRLGGVSALAYPATVVMQAVYDLVLVETVGVGQSETEIAGMTDAVMLCIQPASGDSLQFMKAGIMEVPDLAVVTKADLGASARRAAADLRIALGVAEGASLPVHLCSAQSGEGVDEVFDAILSSLADAPSGPRQNQASHWLRAALLADFGTEGLRRVPPAILKGASEDPFTQYERCRNILADALAGLDFGA